MRQVINRVRALRDELRQGYSRWRYDRPMPLVERIETLRRVVFMRWDAKWGDSVVFSFVCRELRVLHPGISVEVIATPEMAGLFRDQFGVDRVHETRKKPSRAEMRALAERIGSVDLVVHFSKLIKPRDMYLLSLVRTNFIAGLDDSVGRVGLKLGQTTHGLHFADKYVALLERCGADSVDTRYIVPRDPESDARVETVVSRRAKPFICFNAYSKGRARSLNCQSSKRLIEMLLEHLPERDVCVLSAPGRQEDVEALCRQFAGGRVFCFPDTRTIYDNIALIAHAEGLVSGITATVHMADGLGVPSLALFPYDPRDRDDWHSRHPLSVNLMAEPGDPLDVNRLDWNEVERELKAFCRNLRNLAVAS